MKSFTLHLTIFFSFRILIPQQSFAQKFLKEMGFGVLYEGNYMKLTNEGGKGGIGYGLGAFFSGPIGDHLELKAELYAEASKLNYQFNYRINNSSSTKNVIESGKEKLDVSPFVLALNFFPEQQHNFFVGVGYAAPTGAGF